MIRQGGFGHNERTLHALAQFLERDEEVLATGRAETGPVGMHWDLLMSLPGVGYFFLRSWHLAVTDRRLVILRKAGAGPNAPWMDRSYRYSELSEMRVKEGGLYRVLEFSPADGGYERVRLPYRRNELRVMEDALRRAAPRFFPG